MPRTSVSRYLFTRLAQLGVKSLHGVPGDFNLASLDALKHSGMNWVGNCNELNAGYAADGYARVKKMGALATTFGVGELSAINALAGSFAEHVPVVQIVGQPSTKSRNSKAIVHHTLGDGDFSVFAEMHKKITAAQTILDNPSIAPEEIDRVLTQCWLQSRPVYIGLPSDISVAECDSHRLTSPLNLAQHRSPRDLENFVVNAITKRLYAAKKPLLLVDAGVTQHRLQKEVQEFVMKSNLPTVVTPMGKGCVDETLSNFYGLYEGGPGLLTDLVKESDLVISMGAVKSDINTFGFAANLDPEVEIELQQDSVEFDFGTYKVPMLWAIERLTAELDFSKLQRPEPHIFPGKKIAPPTMRSPKHSFTLEQTAITHDYFWPRISTWLKPRDIILNSSGTSNMGIRATKFPSKVQAISQVLWSSIGYTLAATQGAALAAQQLPNKSRVICFEGDGAFQMTAQEISTMLKHRLKPIIFVLVNDGFTIERWINGWTESYNDIVKWDYAGLPSIFATKDGTVKSYKVTTPKELECLLTDDDFGEARCLQIVELHMPWEDAPYSVKYLVQQLGAPGEKS